MTLQLFEGDIKKHRSVVKVLVQYIDHPTSIDLMTFKLSEDYLNTTAFLLFPSEYVFGFESLHKQKLTFFLRSFHFCICAKQIYCGTEQQAEVAFIYPGYIIGISIYELCRVGAERWCESVRELPKFSLDTKVLSLAAADVLYLDSNRDMAKGFYGGHTASKVTLGEAVVRGILSTLK